MQCASHANSATFFRGGVPSASAFKALSSSALRFCPAWLDSDTGDGDFLSSILKLDVALGGVERNDCASGVPERLRLAISERKRAAKLFVEATASA
jgi:hypothetical protein